MKALAYGEIIWDVFPEKSVIGGAPFNFSAHLSHLWNEAYLISAVGNDELGESAISEAKKHGIKTEFIEKNSYPTGACLVTLNDEGVPQYNVLKNVSYDNITVDGGMLERIASLKPDVFYFNTLIQRSETSRKALKTILENVSFPEIFCDINLRENCFDKESLSLCMERSTIVKISDEEGHYLYDLGLVEENGESLPFAVARKYPNLKLIVYTLGKKGSAVLDTRGGRLYESGEPEKIKVVSTVGAGDCYGATFISGIFSGKTIPEAIKAATERSNIVVSHTEAVPF